MGRWRLREGEGSRWTIGVVDLDHEGTRWRLRYTEGIKAFPSENRPS